MVSPTKLPPEDNVLRYVRKNLLRRDEDGNVLGILPQALELRDGEKFLSVTWLEHFDDDYEAGYQGAAGGIRNQLEVKPRDGFSAANVEQFVETCINYDVNIRLLHEPESVNTGHCAARQYRNDNLQLLDVLAETVFRDVRYSKDVP